ncbi:MAG: shikimate kinase [Candidatus Zixiibacteriota bacterium]
MAPKKHIFLVGFSGSGKSTLGPQLARLFKARFYDTDTLVERQCGKSIAQIFDHDGEAFFRRLETQTIIDLLKCCRSRMVIALGGGALQRRRNRDVVKRNGMVVYLSCSVRQIYRRIRNKTDRPLLRVNPAKKKTERQAVMKRIKGLLEQRRPIYAQADIRVSTTSKSIAETLRELQRKISAYDARSQR